MDDKQAAVVFGGSHGIGEATAKILKDGGAHVTIVGRDSDRIIAAAERIGEVEAAVADAMCRDSISRVFEKTGAVDMVIICVAGGLKGIIRPFLELDLDGVRATFEQKTLAQLRVAQVAAHHMRANGSMTFVTATSARTAIPGAVGSAAANGALEGTILSLASELRPIRVNAVSPGLIDTPLWDFMPADARTEFLSTVGEKLPLGRPGQANEIAEIIVAVAKCGYVTGSIYDVDGGGRMASL